MNTIISSISENRVEPYLDIPCVDGPLVACKVLVGEGALGNQTDKHFSKHLVGSTLEKTFFFNNTLEKTLIKHTHIKHVGHGLKSSVWMIGKSGGFGDCDQEKNKKSYR